MFRELHRDIHTPNIKINRLPSYLHPFATHLTTLIRPFDLPDKTWRCDVKRDFRVSRALAVRAYLVSYDCWRVRFVRTRNVHLRRHQLHDVRVLDDSCHCETCVVFAPIGRRKHRIISYHFRYLRGQNTSSPICSKLKKVAKKMNYNILFWFCFFSMLAATHYKTLYKNNKENAHRNENCTLKVDGIIMNRNNNFIIMTH